MSPRRVLSLWGPVALYAAALFAASARSQLPAFVELFWDKLVHASAWAALALLALRATHGGKAPLRWGATIGAAALSLTYGLTDEIHQSFVPGRDSSLLDILADGVGTAAAIGAVAAWQALTRHRAKTSLTPPEAGAGG